MTLALTPPDWTSHARCAQGDVDPDLWYANSSQERAVNLAKRLCKEECVVRAACLADIQAVEAEGASADCRHGIWAGTTPHERAGVDEPIVTQHEAQCGTDSGYYRHVRYRHESACESCRLAHRVKERDGVRRRRAARRQEAESDRLGAQQKTAPAARQRCDSGASPAADRSAD